MSETERARFDRGASALARDASLCLFVVPPDFAIGASMA
jgi:hypothetical protein